MIWAEDWSGTEIRAARDRDRRRKQVHYASLKERNRSSAIKAEPLVARRDKKVLTRFWNWITRL